MASKRLKDAAATANSASQKEYKKRLKGGATNRQATRGAISAGRNAAKKKHGVALARPAGGEG